MKEIIGMVSNRKPGNSFKVEARLEFYQSHMSDIRFFATPEEKISVTTLRSGEQAVLGRARARIRRD